jgi:bacterioferritin (cytochrome b1)
MDNPAIAAVLNQLLDAEQQSLVLRIAESMPYVSLAEVAAGNLVRAMAQTSRTHREQLTEMILDFGGQPVPRRADLLSGNLHYLDLFAMLPLLLEAQESLVAQYKQRSPRLASDRKAAELAGKILARHEADLQKLRAAIPTHLAARAG